MGTIVTIDVVGVGRRAGSAEDRAAAVERAFDWFRRIEASCSRFEPTSELRQLTARVGQAVPVSAELYHAVELAVAVAVESGGAFDPTVGVAMEARGFNREYRSGAIVRSAIAPDASATYRDVRLDPGHKTITLLRPLTLDLGAVAKGLAVDLAARELAPFENFAIDAGGDLYLGGRNVGGEPWTVGIRHPRLERQLLATIRVSDRAVCTSGDYERRGPGRGAGDHHILNPRTGESASGVASVTVVARTAMLADALGTAAFVLGSVEGLRFLERQGVEGLVATSGASEADARTDDAVECRMTRGMTREYSLAQAAARATAGALAVLPNT
jgi:FAD:protein FMN transferase